MKQSVHGSSNVVINLVILHRKCLLSKEIDAATYNGKVEARLLVAGNFSAIRYKHLNYVESWNDAYY